MGRKLMLSNWKVMSWLLDRKIFYKCFLISLGLILLALFTNQAKSQSASATASVLAIRSHGNSSDARFVVELSKFTQYKLFSLDKPHRLVLDLKDTRNAKNFDIEKQELINQLRYSTKKNLFRIVLDLNSAFSIVGYGSLKGLSNDKSVRIYVDIKKTGAFKSQSFVATKLDAKLVNKFPNKDDLQKKSITASIAKSNVQSGKISSNSNKKVIVIDPGHGGKDPGAIAKANSKDIYEKDIVLKFSKSLFEQINKMQNYKAILTRTDDSFIPLRDRYAIAEKNNADLFLSVHADSLKDKSVHGVSIYTLSTEASDKEASELAKQNNRSDILNDYSLNHLSKDVSGILINLAQETTNRKSWLLANNLVSIIKKKHKTINKPLRQADFAVLKSPNIPSILLEIGFLSNKEDIKIMSSLSYNKKVSKLVADGIKKFFEN